MTVETKCDQGFYWRSMMFDTNTPTLPSGVARSPSPSLPAAACRLAGVDPSWFFPTRGEPDDNAKAVCARCDEIEPCRELALADPLLSGIWGGLNGLERKRERHRRRHAEREDSHSMADPAPIELDEEPTEAELEAIDAEATCSQCDRPAVAGRPTCGNPDCVAEHRRSRKRESYAQARANGDNRPRSRGRPPRLAITPAARNGNGAHADARDHLGPMFAALSAAGASVVRLDVQVAGERWTLSRTEGAQ